MLNNNTIAVVIPCYNQGQYLEEAIQSVLNQTFQDFEIVIVDDGSTDNTPQLLEGYVENIKVLRQKNAGVSAARNRGIKASSGQLMAFLGPSGCGKTTFLRIICGLEQQTSGDLLIGGDIVNDMPPRARGVAMMFQSYALYPHMTVRGSMAFALNPKLSTGEQRHRIDEAADLAGAGDLLDRRTRVGLVPSDRRAVEAAAERALRLVRASIR